MRRTVKYIVIGIALIAVICVTLIYAVRELTGFGPGLSDYEYRIANSCTLNRYSAYEINIDCDGVNKRIDSEVFEVGWNDIYLIAATHPVTKRKYPNNPDNTYSEPDESITYWWIRDLINKKGYGPISEEEFNQKKNELKIPGIRLFSVDEARKKGTEVDGQ